MARRRASVTVGVVLAAALLAACTGSSSAEKDPAVGPASSPTPSTTEVDLGSTDLVVFSTNEQGQIAVMRPDRTGLDVLLSGGACCPAVSPDGTRLLFVSGRSDGTGTAAGMRTDGSDRWVLPPDGTLHLVPGVWASDGQHLLLAADDPVTRGRNGVFITGERGEAPRRLTRTRGFEFDLPVGASPDGRLVLFLRLTGSAGDQVGDLYVVPVRGGRPVRLNPAGTSARYLYVTPGNFFPDSRQVVFAAIRGRDGAEGAVMVVKVDGSPAKRLTAWGGWTTSAHVSPDGRWVVFDKRHVNTSYNEVFLVHPDGSNLHRVESVDQSTCCAVWSPDSTRLVFSTGGDQANNVAWASIDGGETHALTSSSGVNYSDYGWAVQVAD